MSALFPTCMQDNYFWSTEAGMKVLTSRKSNYRVGFVLPSTKKKGQWAWSVEHVPSGAQGSGLENSEKLAQERVTNWLTELA